MRALLDPKLGKLIFVDFPAVSGDVLRRGTKISDPAL
jgi:hypothetical protein